MNQTLKAVIIEVTGGNIRNHHINLRGAFGLFPGDAFGGASEDASATPISLRVGAETVMTDIDETKAIFRKRGIIRRFFEAEGIVEGDLLMVERIDPRTYCLSKVSKRVFNNYL